MDAATAEKLLDEVPKYGWQEFRAKNEVRERDRQSTYFTACSIHHVLLVLVPLARFHVSQPQTESELGDGLGVIDVFGVDVDS